MDIYKTKTERRPEGINCQQINWNDIFTGKVYLHTLDSDTSLVQALHNPWLHQGGLNTECWSCKGPLQMKTTPESLSCSQKPTGWVLPEPGLGSTSPDRCQPSQGMKVGQ